MPLAAGVALRTTGAPKAGRKVKVSGVAFGGQPCVVIVPETLAAFGPKMARLLCVPT